jgi:predicted nucleotidyltransferase
MTSTVMPATDRSLTELVEKTRAAFGADLVSVVLYGSAAEGDYHRNYSDFNIVCVLREITPKQLRASEPVLRWWREKGNPSPLMLSVEEVRNSTDCFPIEFHDIRAHHRILFGEDLVSGIQIGDVFYRAQVEHDLRAKLLRLRQKASGLLSDKEALRRLLVDSVGTFCVLTRHALILSGETVPVRKREVMQLAEAKLGIDARPFLTLLDLREERAKEKSVDPDPLLAVYMLEIGKVIAAVDALHKGRPDNE